LTVRRRISPIDSFPHAVDALGSPAAQRLVHALLQTLAENPRLCPELEEWDIHVLRTNAYGPYPALSLYYKYDEEAVYPLHVEPCDPLPLVDPAAPDDA
jgi:hypothetical protein